MRYEVGNFYNGVRGTFDRLSDALNLAFDGDTIIDTKPERHAPDNWKVYKVHGTKHMRATHHNGGPKVVCSMELDYREAKREAIRFCKGG